MKPEEKKPEKPEEKVGTNPIIDVEQPHVIPVENLKLD